MPVLNEVMVLLFLNKLKILENIYWSQDISNSQG